MPRTRHIIDPDQLVFPFYRDSAYEKQLLISRIEREVERGIQTTLTDRLSEIVVTTCFKIIEDKTESAVTRAVAPLAMAIHELSCRLNQSNQDPADWWRQEDEDHDDNLPF